MGSQGALRCVGTGAGVSGMVAAAVTLPGAFDNREGGQKWGNRDQTMERKPCLSLALESVAETPQMRFCVRVSMAGRAPRRPLSWEIGSVLAGPRDLAMASRRLLWPQGLRWEVVSAARSGGLGGC